MLIEWCFGHLEMLRRDTIPGVHGVMERSKIAWCGMVRLAKNKESRTNTKT